MSIATQQLLIDGQPANPANGDYYDHHSPVDGEVVSRAAAAGVEDANAAVAAAASAFPAWAALGGAERAKILRTAADLIDTRAAEIAGIMTEELGATFGWGMFNSALAAGILRAAADLPGQVADEKIPSAVPGLDAYAVRAPLGVVVAIAPWNAPVILATRSVAAPLGLGNTVVFKASEQCPRTHGAVIQAIHDAGLPAGALALLTNRPEDGPPIVNSLIDNPAVRHVNFTGSTGVGRAIAIRAAGKLKPTLLELGGKAPFVVVDDADLDEAAAAASFGAFMNSGQICMSTERIIAQDAVAEDLTARLVARAGALPVGDPADPSVAIGPVVSIEAAQRIAGLIEDAVAHGATVVVGGQVEGAQIAPTVITGVTPEMRIYSEESFGPVITITTALDDDEAVALANDTQYGLAAAVFSSNLERARAIADRIDSGIVHINGATVHDEPQVPFGGVKSSGWGRFGGIYAVAEFTQLRWLTVQNGSRHYPI